MYKQKGINIETIKIRSLVAKGEYPKPEKRRRRTIKKKLQLYALRISQTKFAYSEAFFRQLLVKSWENYENFGRV
jgi:hypothetical protein